MLSEEIEAFKNLNVKGALTWPPFRASPLGWGANDAQTLVLSAKLLMRPPPCPRTNMGPSPALKRLLPPAHPYNGPPSCH
jgi:hypothetical protein